MRTIRPSCGWHATPQAGQPPSSRRQRSGRAGPRRLEDYALLGDNHTATLVHRDGSVDWWCVPRFDSPAVFAALVGTVDNGRWRLTSAETPSEHTRRYRGDTLILETDIATSAGKVRVVDFMVPGMDHPSLVRIVVGLESRVEMTTDIRFRFNYGEVAPWVRRAGDTLIATGGADCLVLRTPVVLHGQGYATMARFDVAAGNRIPFVLTWGPSDQPPPPALDPEATLADTEAYWGGWSSRLTYQGRYRNTVIRSLLTLKALSYEPTGGIVAAPTTSLPEQVGGTRNWDYRYSWLRDASITLGALVHSGYTAEAQSWRNWLLRAAAGDPDKVQIMYGVGGERHLPESELDWLTGYAGSSPVRIGNAAARQMQLDVYGEVIMALELAREAGLDHDPEVWNLQRALLGAVQKKWRQPDHGIWETRGAPRHFVSSKILAWVAADRMIRAAERHGLPGPVDSWRSLRSQIRAQILERGYDPVRNTFVQAYGSTKVDASLLLIPLVGFLAIDDPRVEATIKTVETELTDNSGLLLRYRTDKGSAVDGLPPGEGVFLACSFWLADTYVLAGRLNEATDLFERLLELANDLGLLSEEYDPSRRTLVGNFPQALTHLSVVHTAQLITDGVGTGSAVGRWLGSGQRPQVDKRQRHPRARPDTSTSTSQTLSRLAHHLSPVPRVH